MRFSRRGLREGFVRADELYGVERCLRCEEKACRSAGGDLMEMGALRLRQYCDGREGNFASRIPCLAFAAEALLFAVSFYKRCAMVAAEPHDLPPCCRIGDKDGDLGFAACHTGSTPERFAFARAALEGHGDLGACGVGRDLGGRSRGGFGVSTLTVRVAMLLAPALYGSGITRGAIAPARSSLRSTSRSRTRARDREARRGKVVERVGRGDVPHEEGFGGMFGLGLFYPITQK